MDDMKSSLGILAHNEEMGIAATLADLWKQTWLKTGADTEVLCVVNGSRDRTAEVARGFFEAHPLPGTTARVIEIEKAGKANAWNEYVHHLSAADAGLLFLVDADIGLPAPDTLERLAAALQNHPAATVSVDQPVKDLALRGDAGMTARLSKAAADLAAAGPPKLCGQLYAARAEALRRIRVPEGLLVEDGFIKAMLLTDNLRIPEDLSRIVRAEGAWHVFEAEAKISTLLRHERRILIGTVMNILLFGELQKAAAHGEDIAEGIRVRNARSSDWVSREIGGRWRDIWGATVRETVGLPLKQWRQAGRPFRLLPGVLARAAFNALAAVSAGRELRRRRFEW